eukprot:scaffold14046_cov112-Isochrysis_galbana.AAC.3
MHDGRNACYVVGRTGEWRWGRVFLCLCRHGLALYACPLVLVATSRANPRRVGGIPTRAAGAVSANSTHSLVP